jgi:hypothetical protein
MHAVCGSLQPADQAGSSCRCQSNRYRTHGRKTSEHRLSMHPQLPACLDVSGKLSATRDCIMAVSRVLQCQYAAQRAVYELLN